MNEQTMAPVAPEQRIAVIDAVRGFALLGIALMNIEFFSRPMQGIAFGLDTSMTGLDYAAGWLVMAFVQGKFWLLFSLLFGMGFALMMERAEARGGGFGGVYLRRLLVLALFGAAHAVLLWPGDILLPYAIVGLLMLLLFRRTPVRRLWKWGLALYTVPIVLMWLMAGAISLARMDPKAAVEVNADLEEGSRLMREAYAAAEPVYRDGSWIEVTAQRASDTLMQLQWLPMFGWMLLGIFLMGAWLLRSGAMREPAAHLPLFRRLLFFGLPVGAMLVVVAMSYLVGSELTVPTPELALGNMLMASGSLLLGLAYLSGIVLLSLGPWPGLKRLLAPVGRMALTNYLLQSVVFSTLFYGYGFGLWGQVSRFWQLVLVVVVFALQIAFSHFWMARFRYGPMEWLWRTLTYLRPPSRA